jgi:putative PIN family toxin of toxin-antitoxin system
VRRLVLDTNIVLDAFVFNDPATQPLKRALASQQHQWITTHAMREELMQVLGYPKIAQRMVLAQINAAHVLAQLDGQATLVDSAPKAGVRCSDPDDQKFIDLAVAHKATLLSRDHAVLCMAKRLLALEVRAQRTIIFVV